MSAEKTCRINVEHHLNPKLPQTRFGEELYITIPKQVATPPPCFLSLSGFLYDFMTKKSEYPVLCARGLPRVDFAQNGIFRISRRRLQEGLQKGQSFGNRVLQQLSELQLERH